jgi:hypothetical protein
MTIHRCVALLAFVLAAAPAQEPAPRTPPAQEPAQPGAPAQVPGLLDPRELARAMTATVRFATPGPQHGRLASLAGDWTVELALSPPGQTPALSSGKARAAMVLGGRYLVVDLVVPVQDVAVEGLYIFGFDNLRGLYSASWRDSLSTWSIECLGRQDRDDAQRIDLQGLLFDAVSPEGRPFRLDFVIESADRFTLAVVDTIGDRQQRVMEQRFVRAPAAAPGKQAGK